MVMTEETNVPVEDNKRESLEEITDFGAVLLLSVTAAYLFADLVGAESYVMTLPAGFYLSRVISKI
jgi:hypothetical protein